MTATVWVLVSSILVPFDGARDNHGALEVIEVGAERPRVDQLRPEQERSDEKERMLEIVDRSVSDRGVVECGHVPGNHGHAGQE